MRHANSVLIADSKDNCNFGEAQVCILSQRRDRRCKPTAKCADMGPPRLAETSRRRLSEKGVFVLALSCQISDELPTVANPVSISFSQLNGTS